MAHRKKGTGTICAQHRAPTEGWSGRSGKWCLSHFLARRAVQPVREPRQGEASRRWRWSGGGAQRPDIRVCDRLGQRHPACHAPRTAPQISRYSERSEESWSNGGPGQILRCQNDASRPDASRPDASRPDASRPNASDRPCATGLGSLCRVRETHHNPAVRLTHSTHPTQFSIAGLKPTLQSGDPVIRGRIAFRVGPQYGTLSGVGGRRECAPPRSCLELSDD